MNPSLILKAIPAINEDGLSLAEFTLLTGLGERTSRDLLIFLARNGIGSIIDSNQIEFGSLDRMHAAILAIRMGADVEELSKILDWRDFEVLTAKMLEASGYITYHAFRLKKPRVEIDVVGIKDEMALLIDCKHWKRGTPSELRRFATMQVERAEAFLRANEGRKGRKMTTMTMMIRSAIPAILTLHMESVALAEGVPVVPITKFRSFLNEMHGYLDRIRMVSAPE